MSGGYDHTVLGRELKGDARYFEWNEATAELFHLRLGQLVSNLLRLIVTNQSGVGLELHSKLWHR